VQGLEIQASFLGSGNDQGMQQLRCMWTRIKRRSDRVEVEGVEG
jgi:hypothetical protein